MPNAKWIAVLLIVVLLLAFLCAPLVLNRSGGEAPDMAEIKTETVLLPGNVPLELVWIKPGAFMMGSPDTEQDRQSREGPEHQVTLTQGFWIGKYELTQAQWTAVMDSNPSSSPGSNRPVEMVSWNDAQNFVAALNTAKPDMLFRLPTEAEWEYACRAGTETRFSHGDDPGYAQLGDFAWHKANAGKTGEKYAHAVGQKRPNAWGLHDMHGNVWEWCQDWAENDYYSNSPDTDPPGPASGKHRALRGGSWQSGGKFSRSGSRDANHPGNALPTLGFRIVRAL